MKPGSNRRARRRQPSTRDAGGPQSERKPDQKFFGPESHAPFFPPAAVQRASDPDGKKEEKLARAPEEKKEEKAMRAAAPGEDKREEKIAKLPEEKKEEKVARAADTRRVEAGGSTLRYVGDIHGKGDPLPAREQEFFARKMGFDFSAVRIHTGEAAAASAKDASAKAYTYKNHIVFNDGRYAPETNAGRRLLAHELAHVVQQGEAPAPGLRNGPGGHSPSPGPENGGAGRQAAKPGQVARDGLAPEKLARQTGTGTGTAAPTTATDPAAFRTRLSIALSQMTMPTVAGETLSGTLEPVLREMAANAEWRDASGNSTGGAEVSARLSERGRTVRLRLVLDDSANPPLTGRFDSSGADSGTLRVYVRDNGDADTLATTLYHESLHMMRWLARNAPGGDLVAETGATGGRRATLEDIDPARHPRHLADVRRRVADLAASVNAARPASDRVDSAGIDRVADFVLEEYLTRVETEVFRLMRDSDAASRRPGASVRIGTSADTFFPRADVDKYLFEINSVFRQADRAALDAYDRGRIDELYGYFRDRVAMFVRRRYSEVIHGPEFP